MPCATLAISIAIIMHPNARPNFSEAVFAKDSAATSKRLQRAQVSRLGDIYFNHYGKCATVRFTLKSNDQHLQFTEHPLKTAKSNIDPFKEPAADDPDFKTTPTQRPDDERAPKNTFRFDWISKISGYEYRLYKLDISNIEGHSVSIDPKISNSGVSF
jgi:hypothetical protein